MGLKKRIRAFAQRSRILRGAGVTPASILLLPLRRRLPVRMRLHLQNGIQIDAPVGEPLLELFQEIWIDRCYTRNRFIPQPGQTVIDIGAHVGVFSLWIASQCRQTRVIAVEPSPRSFSYLARNVDSSNLTNIELVQAACGARSGLASLYKRGPALADTLYPQNTEGTSCPVLGPTSVLTLDELLYRFQIETCALLKIDCEGAEYEILQTAAQGTLSRIRCIAMEYHVGLTEPTPDALIRSLAAAGFSVEREAFVDGQGGYLYADR